MNTYIAELRQHNEGLMGQIEKARTMNKDAVALKDKEV